MFHWATGKMSRRLIAFVLILIFTGVGASISAFGENPQPTPVSYGDYNNEKPDRESKIRFGLYYTLEGDEAATLFNIKTKLYNYGYYANIEVDRNGRYLDGNDMIAIADCWEKNTHQAYPAPNYGLTYGAMDLILGNNGEVIIDLTATPSPTAPAQQYHDIAWEEGGEPLLDVVNRLSDLRYLENRDVKVYDESVREAIDLFGKNNGFQNYYSEDNRRPITAHLQDVLMSDSATPLPEEAPRKFSLREYFASKVKIIGIGVPMMVLWGIGLVALIASVFAAFYFFGPQDNRKGVEKQHKVHFVISYMGETHETDAELNKPLKIGRGIGDFPINLEDTKISRKHCELYYKDNTLILQDYSANGTLVNGRPVNNAQSIIANGDIIAIGDHTITVTF